MVLKKSVISKVVRMSTKYFLKPKLHFQYDPISRNPERISLIRLNTAN
jgi:ribosome-binding factor A